jgi:glucosamine kinase
MWIIGIDGGGTKCQASLFSPDGRVVAASETGPANLFVDFELALKSINDACALVLAAANSQPGLSLEPSDCFLSLGCAGASIPAAQHNIAQWQHPYADVALTTDIHISCLAANNENDCALIITGTGSSIAIYQNQVIRQFGGHGFLLGDIASGAWLGKKAVSWFLQALETPHQDPALHAAVAELLGPNVNDIIQVYGHAKPAKFAALVPNLLSCQAQSHNVQAWLDEGLSYLANIITHHAEPKTDVFMHGGIAHVYQQSLSQRLNRPIMRPKHGAVAGAFAFAKLMTADVA